MTRKWEIDKKFLQQTINDGYKMIDDPKTPKSEISEIRYTIKKIKHYLNGNFELIGSDRSKPPRDEERLKNYVLRKMKKQYKELGPELINWLIDLSDEYFFDSGNFIHRVSEEAPRIETIDEQAELTLETYRKHSKKYYAQAKRIISSKYPKQIQLIEDGSVGSYCWTNFINNTPLLIIDPCDASWVLNHELQHGIEDFLDYDTPNYFSELGATYFELLFNDELYKHQGSISFEEYSEKMDDVDLLISTTADYFRTLLEVANRKFEVSTEKLMDLCIEYNDIDPEDVYEFLRFDVATNETEEDMDYVFSYLKAIELREKHQNSKKDSADLLEPYTNTRRFHFDIPQNGYEVYENFVEEVKQKTKTQRIF